MGNARYIPPNHVLSEGIAMKKISEWLLGLLGFKVIWPQNDVNHPEVKGPPIFRPIIVSKRVWKENMDAIYGKHGSSAEEPGVHSKQQNRKEAGDGRGMQERNK